MHNDYPDFDTDVPGVLVTAFADGYGPMQPEDWQQGLAIGPPT
ncbi:hypothetical protein ACFVYT_40440 [Streptomyces sp. NPDC058290]